MKQIMKRWSTAATVAALGLMVTLLLGTWWVAMAIEDGEPLKAVTRLSLAGLCGAYYVVLLQAVTLNRGKQYHS